MAQGARDIFDSPEKINHQDTKAQSFLFSRHQFWRWTFRKTDFNNCSMTLNNFLPRRISATKLAILISTLSGAATTVAPAEESLPVLQIQADKIVAKMPLTFYGLMTEEINYSYEGGLYGELIRNRTFKADTIQEIIKPENYEAAKYYPVKIAVTNAPKFWSPVGNAGISLDTNTPLNNALNVSLKLELAGASKNSPAGVANDGYWGIPLKPSTTYHASFFAKAKNFNGALTLSLVHLIDPKSVKVTTPPGTSVFLGETTTTAASATVSKISSDWKKYEVAFTTSAALTPSKENRLVISATEPGTIWLQQVSLMPPTYKDRVNGNRTDLSQLLDDAHPKFLRFPGGNYVEGDYFSERFNWKETIGPIEQRPGHRSC